MDDILTEGDFDDFAAAVGEGGDGSDEDASVRRTQHNTPSSQSDRTPLFDPPTFSS